MEERQIDRPMIIAAIEFGEKLRGKDSLYYFLGHRGMKRLLKVYRPRHPERWEGTVIVCDPVGEIMLTCFKSSKWPKKIRH